MPITSNQPDAATLEYCRRARRLRGRLARQPAPMHRALAALSVPPPPPPQRPAVTARTVLPAIFPHRAPRWTAEAFARRVRAEINGGVLSYSNRTRLLAIAAGIGIERFEANLIIASVLNDNGPRRGLSCERKTPRAWLVPLIAVCLMQTAVAAAAWWLFSA